MRADVLEDLLNQAGYPRAKTQFLISGFKEGFSIGYNGPQQVKQTAPYLKLNVGSKVELWNKVMKEVKLKRYAGPFKNIPFENYSPIGLVPKDDRTKTPLIFHLSYPQNSNTSVNVNTPAHLYKVKYSGFDQAIARCIEEGIGCSISKSDMSSAFRNLGIKRSHWPYLVIKAVNPRDGLTYYFIDKCLSFGASISCAHFQAFSDAVAFLMKHRWGKKTINYLDDFFFAALLKAWCKMQVQQFIDLCCEINFPVSMEKTEWGTTKLVFLGMLIDTVTQLVAVPDQKVLKAKSLIYDILSKKKVMVHKLQSLCSFLNFLGRCVVLGRAFMRRLYAPFSGENCKLKSHHHVKVTGEMRLDLQAWQTFLAYPAVFSRPFLDFTDYSATEIEFFTDTSKTIGFGGYCGSSWMHAKWDPIFIREQDPSIGFLELFGVTLGILSWVHRFRNH